MVDNGRMNAPLIQPPLDWGQIFALWRVDGEPTTWPQCCRIAESLRVKDPRSVRLWLKRNAMPMEYWPTLIAYLERKWGLIVSSDQLVQATLASRCRKREAA